jgi:hypothetical protein
MTDSFEDFKKYLPQYLSATAQINLFAELEQFPSNIDSRFYTTKLREEPNIFQGDGLHSLWITDLPNDRIAKGRVMVVSNSCDISLENKRLLGPRLIYCPIISISKLTTVLKSSNTSEGFDFVGYFDNVRKQRISSMFYLPNVDKLGGEAVALLDRMNNCDAQAVDIDAMVNNRLFTLSDYGFYLFLFKLSIHLTRIRERVERN